MNKFAKMLGSSSKEIRGARATLLSEDARFAQEELVRTLESEKRDLDRKLVAATDLYPDSELTLMVTRKDFEAKAWVSHIQKLKVALTAKNIELNLAKETYAEWFTEVPVKEKSAKPASGDDK